MYIFIDDNPNCESNERVFAAIGDIKTVQRVSLVPPGQSQLQWCDVVGVDEFANFKPARVVRVEDSADGTAWLIFGEAWGLRLKPKTVSEEWSLESKNQWGVPFLVLDSSDSTLELA